MKDRVKDKQQRQTDIEREREREREKRSLVKEKHKLKWFGYCILGGHHCHLQATGSLDRTRQRWLEHMSQGRRKWCQWFSLSFSFILSLSLSLPFSFLHQAKYKRANTHHKWANHQTKFHLVDIAARLCLSCNNQDHTGSKRNLRYCRPEVSHQIERTLRCSWKEL